MTMIKTIAGALGRYEFLRAPTSAIALGVYFAWLSYLLFLLISFSANVMYYYTPDSWYYLAIANSFGTDHVNSSNIIRQYQFPTSYNVSFPPLWPLVVWLTNSLFDFGYYANLVAAGALFVAAMLVVEYTFHRAYGALFAGALCAAVLLLYRPFVLDLIGGMSGSLNLFLLSLAVMISYSATPKRAYLMGLVGGLLFLTRFDNVPIVIALLLITVAAPSELPSAARWHDRGKKLVEFASVFALVVAPLLVWNLLNIGVPLASDNSIVFRTLKNTHSTYYFFEPPRVISDDVLAWIDKFRVNFLALMQILLASGLPLALPVPILVLLWSAHRGARLDPLPLALLLGFSLAVIVALAGTGYKDLRYFTPSIFIGTIVLGTRFIGLNAMLKIAIVAALSLMAERKLFNDHIFFYETKIPPTLPADIVAEERVLGECLKEIGATNVLPLFKEPAEGQIVSFFGTRSTYKVFYTPGGIRNNARLLAQFLDKFSVDAIYERTVTIETVRDTFPVVCAQDQRIRGRKRE